MPTSTTFNRALLFALRLPLDGFKGYGVILAALAAVAFSREAIGLDSLPYLFFIPVILLGSVFVGPGAGAFATFGAAFLAGISISASTNPLILSGQQWLTQVLFVAVNLGIVAIGANLRRSVLQLGALSEARRDALERLAAETSERSRLAAIVEQSKDFVGYADLDGRVQYVNEAGRRLVGLYGDPKDTEIVKYFAPDDRDRIGSEIIPTVLRDGSWVGEMRFKSFADGELIPVRYNIFTLYDRERRPIGYGTVTPDLRKEKAAEVLRDELSRELAHRMKNTLSMVQAIATQTLRSSQNLAEARDAIAARLSALARAQDILTATSWSHADIHHVVSAALAPHRSTPDRISIDGPHVELNAPRALGMSLAIHELATNAAKYGALSNDDGHIAIDWTSTGDDFEFHWTETGGPPVQLPESRGFGSKLLERIVAAYFEGKAEIVFDPNGAMFNISGKLGNE